MSSGTNKERCRLTEFIHAKCGGKLVPIPRPYWSTGDDYARCDRCRLPGVVGIVGGQPRLSMLQAEEIRTRYANGERQEILATEFEVSPSVVQKIVKGETYRKEKWV